MRPLSLRRPGYLAVVVAALVTGCGEANSITKPTNPVPTLAVQSDEHESDESGSTVSVADVEHLYAAVNNPANAGTTILLASGTYVLSAKDAAGVSRPNGGRLELQQDMSISGVEDDRAAVVIDATALPASSFFIPIGRTGVIRTGRGTNAVEWLTIAGNPRSAGAIETDLGGTLDAWVTVAHVAAGNSTRGVDVRNFGAANATRRLNAEITDSDLFRGSEGIRVANFFGAVGGQIIVEMNGNRAYENEVGCIIVNNRSNTATIQVRSNGDRFYDNGGGCLVVGGLAASGTTVSSSTALEAHGTAFIDNTRTEFFPNSGPVFSGFSGLQVVGGEELSSVGTTSHNTVTVKLWGCNVSGNQRLDFEAWGARSSDPLRVAGIDNHAIVELHGISKRIDVVGGNSSPANPDGTNTLTIIR